jgi:hypothetical protein
LEYVKIKARSFGAQALTNNAEMQQSTCNVLQPTVTCIGQSLAENTGTNSSRIAE